MMSDFLSYRLSRLMLALALVITATTVSCRKGGHARYAPAEMSQVLGVPMSALQPAIAARVDSGQRPTWVTPERWKRVRMLYVDFGNAPLWLQEGGVKERATALVDAIRSAPDQALDTTAYPISAIQRVLDAKRLTDTASAGTLADADVLLTSAYVAYAADMLAGQVDPRTVSQAWHIAASQQEIDSALVRGIANEDMRASLDSIQPQSADSRALVDAYAHYRKVAASGGWPAVPASGGAAQREALRARLTFETFSDSTAEGLDTTQDSLDASAPSLSTGIGADTSLTAMLKQFQEHHGLERTGRADAATLAALNMTAAERAQQIAANLERHRWLPRTLGSRYVIVNVPAFRLTAYDSGRKDLEMKVVVGEEYQGKVTPVFADSMETVVFRPYWNITPDIQRQETAPKIAADPSYMRRENLEYYKDGGVRRIRQRPGPKNSLGLVKFLFPNDFNIYLHDTPAKSLFDQTDRAASHGCIRLEKPAELAQWVLGWDASRVDSAMNSESDNHSVRVPTKIPVYIVYFTAYTRDGQLYFADDVYSRDEALMRKVGDPADTTTVRS